MLKRTAVPVVAFLGGLLMGASVPSVAGIGVEARDVREPMVAGIGGVFLKAQSPEELRAWYQRHLGLEAGPQGLDFLWRQVDDPSRMHRTVWSLFPSGTDYFGPAEQQFMVNYIVNDLDSTLARLAEAGVQPVKEPEEHPYGRFAWVLDGEGNRIELWEPPASEGQ